MCSYWKDILNLQKLQLESLLEILHTIENYLKPRSNSWKIPVTVLIFAIFARKKPATLLKYELLSDVLIFS